AASTARCSTRPARRPIAASRRSTPRCATRSPWGGRSLPREPRRERRAGEDGARPGQRAAVLVVLAVDGFAHLLDPQLVPGHEPGHRGQPTTAIRLVMTG